jgi:hypothetical protein
MESRLSSVALLTLCFATGVGVCEARLFNVAFGTDATQSSTGYGGSPGKAVDGDAGSWCHSANNSEPHWWRSDLGALYDVVSVEVVGRPGFLARVNGLSLMAYTNAAADGNAVYSNRIDITTGSSQTLAMPSDMRLRSVRIAGVSGDGWMNFCEVRVFSDLLNFAAGSAASASSNYGVSWTADNAVDENVNSVWHSSSINGPHWWQADMGRTCGIDTIKVLARADLPGRVSGMAVTGHTNDLASGTPVYSNNIDITGGLSHVFALPTRTDLRSVRIAGTPTDGWANIAEVYAFGGAPNGQALLAVTSLQGNPSPAGTTFIPVGSIVTAAVESVYTNTDTIYDSTGWTNGTGSVPAFGGTNSVTFTLTNDSSITWQWAPSGYLLTLTEGGGGTTDVHSGWITAGSNLTITAVPSAATPVVWSGDTNGCVITTTSVTNDTISWTMDAPRSLAVSYPVTGLIVRYRFDDAGNLLADSATNTTDHTMSGVGGTIHHDTASHAQGTGSARFNMNPDGTLVPDNANARFGLVSAADPLNRLGEGATYAFWMWACSNLNNYMMPLSWDSGGQVNSPFNFEIRPGAAAKRNMLYMAGGNANMLPVVPVDVERWVHIAATHDMDANTARFYVDGMLRSRQRAMNDLPTSTNEHLRLASRNGEYFFAGRLDDVQIYGNQVASAGEILFLYRNPGSTLGDYDGTRPPDNPDLIVRYTFDNDSAIMADTGTDNVNHSMFGGAPAYDSAEMMQGAGSSLWDGVNHQTHYGAINNQPGLADSLNDLGRGVSYAYWVYPDASGPDYMMTLTWDDGTGGDGVVNRPFAMHFSESVGVTRDLHYHVGAPDTFVTASDVPMDQWSHIAVTHDFSNNTAIIYRDGLPVATNAGMNDVAVSTIDYFRLGNRGGAYRFKGRLDDVQVYRDYVADDTEIAHLYSTPGATLPVTVPPPGGMTLMVR